MWYRVTLIIRVDQLGGEIQLGQSDQSDQNHLNLTKQTTNSFFREVGNAATRPELLRTRPNEPNRKPTNGILTK
jgi:hypothetical protein